jgi:hypothetical protein
MATLTWSILTGANTVPGSISNWLSKASLSSGPDGVADYVLGEAESWIYRRLRHWKMLTPPQAITLTQGLDTLDISSFDGFLEPMDFWYLNNGGPYWMVQKDATQVYQSWSYNSDNSRQQNPPVIYSFNQTYIQFDSPADQTYPGYLTYYKQPAALSSTNQTNFLTELYARLIRAACMASACEWAKDNGQGNFDRTYWDQIALEEIERAKAESDRARRGTINAGVMIGGADSGFPTYPGTWG